MPKAPKDNLNGSTDLLAKAMRKVFVEAVEQGMIPVRKDISGLKADVSGLKADVSGLNKRIDTNNKNVQSQLAQHRKDVSGDVKKIVTDNRKN